MAKTVGLVWSDWAEGIISPLATYARITIYPILKRKDSIQFSYDESHGLLHMGQLALPLLEPTDVVRIGASEELVPNFEAWTWF